MCYSGWLVVCGLWFRVDGLRCVTYGLWFVAYGLWFMVHCGCCVDDANRKPHT